MRVQRTRSQTGLLLSFSMLCWACGTTPAADVNLDKARPHALQEAASSDGKPAAVAIDQATKKALQESLAAAGVPAAVSRPDRTLAPYFFVAGADSAADALPLKSTRADVYIAGTIADVKVSQVYRNQGTKTLEAVYVFPASTRAAVHAMKMTIGQRVIEAQIRERDAARREYAAARARGQTASLLQQERPNVFQMSVANILPGDEIKVELRYVELIVPERHVYEFVYPTTLGPRYSNKPESQAGSEGGFVASPFLPTGTPAAHSFALSALVKSGIPISAIAVPSHADAQITQPQPFAAQIVLPESQDTGNCDVVVRYTLEGAAIDSGLLLEPGEEENHFLLMMEPPARIEPRAVVPREYIFVVDVSGSMYGFPLEVTKKLMQHLIEGLRPEDRFNILSFAGGSALLSPSSLAATRSNLRQALNYTRSWSGGGGTELLPALRQVLALPRTQGMSRSIVIITDGYVDVEKESFQLIRDSLGDANVFAFGIGSAVNRYLIEGMARAGQAEPFIVLNEQEAQEKAAVFQSYIRSPILQGVRVRFEGFDAYDVEPPTLPDLFAEKPILILGKYRGAAAGQIVLSGLSATGKFEQSIDAAGAAVSGKGAVLKTLWARSRVERLLDWDRVSGSAFKKEISQLGMRYQLMTAYTSFIAVDSAVRKGDRPELTVKQPSPLPASVSNAAISSGALGQDAADALGGLVGTEVGEAYGGGGFGLVGSGRGRGGTGEGTIGLGNLGGAGAYGARSGILSGKKGSGPMVELSPTEVRGALDQALVYRIIRRHIREVKFCYEQRLLDNSQLKGHVTLQLAIAATGEVAASFVQSSTLNDTLTEQCIANAARRWEFPKPKGGIVLVIQDFSLHLLGR